METKYEVIPLFPTPLYINEVPKQLVQDHIEYLNSEKLTGSKPNLYGSRSQDTYILNKSIYKNLNQYILQHSINYAEEYMRYSYTNYKFSQSWVSVKSPGEEHVPHHHFNSLISGVLFYGNYTDNTSHITFYNELKFDKGLGSHPKKSILNEFSFESFNILYKPNLLLLFPSTLGHSVSKNTTNIPRKSLAFNVIPRDGFGKEGSLTELKFNN